MIHKLALSEEELRHMKTAAFLVETVAHLKHMERELLPAAEFLRELIKRLEGKANV